MSTSLLDLDADRASGTILKIALVLAALQLLFPPKVWVTGFGSRSLGFVFAFSDPMADANGFAGGFAHTACNWGQLILQLIATAVAAIAATKALEARA